MKKWVARIAAFSMIVSMISFGGSYAEGQPTKIITPDNIPTVGNNAEQKGGEIILREAEKDSWGRDETFVFVLPEGVTWGKETMVNNQKIETDPRRLTVSFKGTKGLDRIVINPVLDVSRRVPVGNIDMTVERGPVDGKDARITLAKVSDYGLALNDRGIRKIVYGDRAPKTITVRLEELIDNSIVRGQAYELTLENATFDPKNGVATSLVNGDKKLEGKFAEDSIALYSNDEETKSSWNIAFDIVPNENVQGNVVLRLKGRGVEEAIVIANISKDVLISLSEEGKVISLGYTGQKLPEISINETKERALLMGSYELKIEPSYKGNILETATIEASDGNIGIDNIKRQENKITFDVVRESTKASTLTIKDVKIAMSNVAYLGEYKAKLQMKVKDAEPTTFGEFLWFSAMAPGKDPQKPVAARVAQFVIGNPEYTLLVKGDKSEGRFDVAPYIESGRTMMSVKAVGDALDMNVTYDDATKTVAIVGKVADSKKVEFKIGEKIVMINGEPQPIDVAPVIKDSRTFVPVSYVGTFFGVKTTWDETLKMVTVTME